MAIRTWVGEAMVFRTLGMIEAGLGAVDANDMDARLRAIEEYAAACSIIKGALSEYCNYVADEMVQIYGGSGYSATDPAEPPSPDPPINPPFAAAHKPNAPFVAGRFQNNPLSGQLPRLPVVA